MVWSDIDRVDVAATEKFLAMTVKWFTDPLKYGDYPQLLKDVRGEVLPQFTDEEKELVKGSTDFLA